MKIIQLRCGSCGGMLDLDENEARTVLFCPYCGSKSLMTESDDVKINRMKYDAEKEGYRHQHDKEYYEYLKEKEKNRAKEESFRQDIHFLIGWFILLVLICILF